VAADSLTIGLLIPPSASDEGVMGARLAIQDNNTTGRFTNQSFTLDEIRLAEGADPAEAARRHPFTVSLLDAASVTKAAESGSLLVNAAAPDETLRGEGCRANLLHTLPDRAMLADALGQYLVKKRWTTWLLVSGQTPNDLAFAEALKRSAKRYGAKIAAARSWSFDRDSKPENEVPTFTQGVDYDAVVVADEGGAFGDLLSYRTWLPRPVVGTHGLVAEGWDPTAEEWGAIQLQNRFRKLAQRPMSSVDYAAWLAVRAFGEAALRAKSTETTALRRALFDPDFTIAGFKGRQLSFRPWDGQLRQPIFLGAANGVIATAPVEGFLHPLTEMDTLGTDRPETHCKTGPHS
jgi:ABC transporter substrate binding protein (PQQ-dependent alcohol dehydrogenase system)